MIDLGDVNALSTVRIPFNTFAADGSSITIGTNGTIAIYKDDSTTERASASGITFSEDHDGNTGTHLIKIDLSDNTTAGFYAAGSDYLVKYNAATIDGKTVNAWVGRFSIDKTTVAANTTKVDGAALGTHTAGLFPVDSAAIATAWGARVLGNSRTADYFLQGGFNKTVRGSTSFTVYSTDDTTILATGPTTADGALSPLASMDPT